MSGPMASGVPSDSLIPVAGVEVSPQPELPADTGTAPARSRVATAGLLRVAEPASPLLAQFVAERGPVDAWRRICAGAVPAGVRRMVAARTDGRDPQDLHRLAIADLRLAASVGGRLVTPEDDEWPEATMIAFAMVEDGTRAAPLGLYVRGGRLPADQRGVVTVIGSRACTAYGRRCATELAGELAAAGCLVVSGAAFGIDAAAHRGAMQARGPAATLAVLACGIDRVYPNANRELVDQIAAGGAVVTEYPPGTTPARHRFLIRNRLIAAFGAVTIVVEAGRRSGTISTANVAQELNRVVMAVPGPVTSAMSIGCHELLRREGVLLAADAADVLEVLGKHDLAIRPALPGRPTDGLAGDTAKVYEALPGRGTRTVWELAAESAVPGDEVMIALAELELLELAERDGAHWRRAGRLSAAP